MANTKTISTDLPANLFNIINAIAAEKQRQLKDIINEALLSYVNEWEECQTAIKRLNDPSDTVLSEEELLNELRQEFGWKV